MAKDFGFTQDAAKRIIAATRTVERMGPNTTGGRSGPLPLPPQPGIHAKITAATAINGAIRWSYTIQIGHWDMSTSPSTGGTWTVDSGETTYTAYNSTEDMNTFTSGSAAIGTGNTAAQTDGAINAGTCKLLGVPVSGYVVVTPRGVDNDGNYYYTIVNFANSAQS